MKTRWSSKSKLGDDRPGRVLSSLTGALAASVYSGLTVFLSVAGAGAGPTECWAGIRLDGRGRMPVDPGPSTSRSRSASSRLKNKPGSYPSLSTGLRVTTESSFDGPRSEMPIRIQNRGSTGRQAPAG